MQTTQKKEKTAQKQVSNFVAPNSFSRAQLVNFSVRAQDYMMKAGLGKTDQLFSPRGALADPATHEDPFQNTMQATTTAASASNGKLELMSLCKCTFEKKLVCSEEHGRH